MATAKPLEAAANDAEPIRPRGGMTPAEIAYMRQGIEPAAGSVPMSTSRFLNSPLFAHAYTQMSLRRLGNDVPTTYDIPDMSRGLDDVTDYADWALQVAIEKAENPVFAEWLDRRQMARFNPQEMGHYADGTLGATIRDFMLKSGYDIEFMNKGTVPANDLQYLMKRSSECHDIQHMVTGFGPNIAGEHALIMMNVTGNARFFRPELAAYISRSPYFLASANLMRSGLHYSAGMPRLLEATEAGIAAGRGLRKPLHIVNWEDYLDWQLDDIAADLGFTRGPGDLWGDADQTLLG